MPENTVPEIEPGKHGLGMIPTRQRTTHRAGPAIRLTPEEYVANAMKRFTGGITGLARRLDDFRYPVDEYTAQTLAPDQLTRLEVLPSYDTMAERIVSVLIAGPPITAQGTPQQGEGQVTSPGAGNVVIAQITAANSVPGTYLCYWWVDLDGTVGATDVNNMRLQVGSTVIQTAIDNGVVGHYEQDPVQLTIPQGGAQVAVKTVAIGTVGAIYTAGFSLVPVNSAACTLQLGDRVWPLVMPPAGILTITPLSMLLQRNDLRVLTSTTPGQWFLELMGWADERY